jgi:hypothetical protein
MAAILLLATPQLAVAQHSGRNTGGMGGGNYPRDTDSGDLKDIQKAFAVQATEEQRTQFQSWRHNTEAVKLRLQELRPAIAANDFSSQINALNAAIEKNNSGYHDFVTGLTDAQHGGLKKQIQNLGKTNDALAKAVASAVHELGSANRSAKLTDKLTTIEKAIENLLNDQKKIADDMSMSA